MDVNISKYIVSQNSCKMLLKCEGLGRVNFKIPKVGAANEFQIIFNYLSNNFKTTIM